MTKIKWYKIGWWFDDALQSPWVAVPLGLLSNFLSAYVWPAIGGMNLILGIQQSYVYCHNTNDTRAYVYALLGFTLAIYCVCAKIREDR